MDHDEAVRQKATERYLLDELEPGVRDQFEEHLFDCQDCALDVRTAAMFVEQSKVVLAEGNNTAPARVPAMAQAIPGRAKPGWFGWLRPALAVPVFALLVAVIGYQNLVTVPNLLQAANQPQVGPWASVNVSTRGASPTVVQIRPGEGFGLLINLPPEDGFASYTGDLYNPAEKLEWSGQIPMVSADQSRQIFVPGGNRQPGTYTLVVHGITPAGESKEISRRPIDVQIQK